MIILNKRDQPDCPLIRKFAFITLAAVVVLGAATLAAPSSAKAAGRAQNQDHRGPDTGGEAIPSGPHIKCVLPFCSNSFHPHGKRPETQDHRPGSNVPPIHNQPRPISNNETNAACLANRTCVSNVPPHGHRPGDPSPQPKRPPIVQPH